tara:strand:- start:2517 stop:3473 length:957 start_codon:yes stop_codon:yes gene_type:complete
MVIWLAQIVRYLDFNQSLGIQIKEVIKITSFLLPNAVNTIIPIIILISTFFFNKHINSTNEVTIFSLYLSKNSLTNILLIIYIFIIGGYLINSELISVNSYNKYKKEEIKFRNDFKIKDLNNEITIPGKILLIYKNKDNENLNNVTSFLIEENIVIKSESVSYSKSTKELIFTFVKGKRISASLKEKSITDFDRLQYKIINTNNDEVSLGKENYNYFQLINHENIQFNKEAHRKIINLFFLILIIMVSNRLILINEKSNNLIKNYLFNLVVILCSFTLLSLVTKLFISENLKIQIFYILSCLTILTTYLILRKKYAFI